MSEEEKCSRRQHSILQAVSDALAEGEYHQLTIEDVAARAGVGKSTIYRWWKHKSELVLDAFKQRTAGVFELDASQSLRSNLVQQLTLLVQALNHPVGRALLVVMANHRELAADFFQQYLLPRRKQTHQLIQQAIQRGELRADYPFDLMLDTLYGPIHYQINFFNRMPDDQYIQNLVDMALSPALISP
ncbi:TetR/AcrR family transcriptional regulator [Acinetobacter variabilis]|uniref:TetR/AcrR family transcriptional regulator n=1 Tax=Acinetobacter variabilis TaxID=70346 RepID=UPI0028A08E56|nr:TetR/AcrR family transcriptional regulator [Acinetobacter variabilis]